MALNALLILSTTTLRRPNKIRATLAAALGHSQRFSGILYVHVWRSPPPPPPLELWETISQLSKANMSIYSLASSQCPNIDVRVILKNSRPAQQQQIETKRSIDLVFVDTDLKEIESVQEFVQTNVVRKSNDYKLHFLSSAIQEAEEEESTTTTTLNKTDNSENTRHNGVILGGTFDRLHNGHKILLSESVIRCEKELIVGVTDESMIKSKLLYELIEPCQKRMDKVQDFLDDISPPMTFRIVPISDPYGPTITEKNIDLIVVSQETIRGAEKINQIRQEQKHFPPLLVHTIDLCSEPKKESDHEEDKISSSSKRLRILGDRLCPSVKEPSLPYIIGLTGGIASGKSTICTYLESLQVATINCDLLGHEAYKPETACFNTIVSTFGQDILADDKVTINRRALGGKVFGKPDELKKLTDIVWPEIRRLAREKIEAFSAQGKDIIVLDAAVLLEAGWNDMCHEVWVAFVPKEEAIRRIQERDQLTQEAAENRINSQLSNQERLAKATFAFCSLWEKEFTRKQVDKAFAQIQVQNRSRL